MTLISGYGSKTKEDSSSIHYATLSVLDQQDCTNKHNISVSDSEDSEALIDKGSLFFFVTEGQNSVSRWAPKQ